MKKSVTNWGRYPKIDAEVFSFDYIDELRTRINQTRSLIARGNGRCYGDASLASNVASSLRFNKILQFDIEQGIFYCQSGILLSDILKIIIPEGWFLPVTPGTKYITVGGAVASDVHGKNHHIEGSFSNHLLEIELILADGTTVTCNSELLPDLFQATCGGMGLTGVILNVKFKLKRIESIYIEQTQVKARNLDEILDLFEKYAHATYSMAWIDCLKGGKQLGRSIMMTGEHSTINQLNGYDEESVLKLTKIKKVNIPFDFPNMVLNPTSVKLFNELYYHKSIGKTKSSTVHFDTFFYPLDSILNWNKMYGIKGFVQYQFVVPLESGRKALVKILDRIRSKSAGSFLAVLKLFGEQESLISFPMKGYTLALDFPIRKGLFQFLDDLDEIVTDHGGRIYLSKDARMDKHVFLSSYPQVNEFIRIIHKYNPGGRFASVQSKRLSII